MTTVVMEPAQETAASCDYCGAPLPPQRDPGDGASSKNRSKFCCYGCRVLGESGRRAVPAPKGQTSVWIKVAASAAIFGQMMILDLAVNLTTPDPEAHRLLHWALFVGAAVVLWLHGPALFRTVRQQFPRPTIELMFSAGIVGAFAASVYASLTGVGAVYYEIVAVLLTVYTAGRTLQAQGRNRAFAEAQRFHETFATARRVLQNGTDLQVPSAQIQVGEQVRVLAGEPIPVDGRIVAGQAFVQQAPLSGEPFPVVRRPGDEVLAGSYSEDGELLITATRAGSGRHLDELLTLATQARGIPSRIQAQADRIVAWFLPFVLITALGTLVFWGWKTGWQAGLFNALAVLVVACPCAMGLATPIALWNSMAAMAARGLVVRSADAIEHLASLTHVAFDKTGTLTEEGCSMVDLTTIGSAEQRQQIQAMIRVVEDSSPHPIAQAFRALPRMGEQDRAYRLGNTKTVPALGVEAWVSAADGTEYHVRIGQRGLMTNLEGEAALRQQLADGPGDQLIYVQVNGQLSAIAAVREQVRASAADVFKALEGLGLQSSILTGDSSDRVARLGLPGSIGSLTAPGKAALLNAWQAEGQRIGFVGDGINDAPALNAAAFGISLGHGSGLSQASAGAVLYGGDLAVVPWAIDLSRRVKRAVRSNLAFAAFYNLVGIVLAVSGYLHPVAAVLLMVISSLTVSWRATRASRGDEFCCVPASGRAASASTAARKPAAPRLAGAAWPAKLLTRWSLAGFLILLQAPFIIYLGRLPFWPALGVALVCGILGFGIVGFSHRIMDGTASTLKYHWQMSVAMLAVGNWGMILGWWVEAGFAPVVGQHLMLGCCAHGSASSAQPAIPWMYIGMVLFSLPFMVSRPERGQTWLMPVIGGILSTVGMVAGMAYGTSIGLALAGTARVSRFLWALGSMIAGMLIGMAIGCESGRAAAWLWNRPSRKQTTAGAEMTQRRQQQDSIRR